jgi:hypothetical protein
LIFIYDIYIFIIVLNYKKLIILKYFILKLRELISFSNFKILRCFNLEIIYMNWLFFSFWSLNTLKYTPIETCRWSFTFIRRFNSNKVLSFFLWTYPLGCSLRYILKIMYLLTWSIGFLLNQIYIKLINWRISKLNRIYLKKIYKLTFFN